MIESSKRFQLSSGALRSSTLQDSTPPSTTRTRANPAVVRKEKKSHWTRKGILITRMLSTATRAGSWLSFFIEPKHFPKLSQPKQEARVGAASGLISRTDAIAV